MPESRICELWFQIVERFALVYGQPLPKLMLALGSTDMGWGVQLNVTGDELGDLPAYAVAVSWNGFPAGVVDPRGGLIAAGELANEQTFREWLPTAERRKEQS